MWPLYCISTCVTGRDGGNGEHRDHCYLGPNTQLMTLRIERSARQGFTVFTLSGRTKAEQVAELKELFDTDYRSITRLARDEAGGSRRGEVPKELREGRDEAGELSGVRQRVHGQRRRLRERRRGTAPAQV